MDRKAPQLRARVASVDRGQGESPEDVAVLHIRFETAHPTKLALAPAAREVLQLVLAGLTNAQIAERRNVTLRTAENQVASLFRKTRTRSRAELIAFVTKGD